MVRSHPHATASEEEGVSEHTGVRVRDTEASELPGKGLERLLARAHVVFRHRPPDDPRVRLLQVAVLRRDEILIEALLRRFDSVPPR